MPISDPNYRELRIGKLRYLASQGDRGAIQALAEAHDRLGARIRDMARIPEALNESMIREARESESQARRAGAVIARQRSAAAEREEAMVRNLAALRQTIQDSAAREAAADERARAAEEREAAAMERSEKRERMMLIGMTVSTVLTVVTVAISLF